MSAMTAQKIETKALQLAEEWGLPVFPVRLIPREDGKTEKKPLVFWKQDATTNLETIASWWRSWPEAVVGVPTGTPTKIFLVDIDPAGDAWYRENATRLECGRTHRTSRGWHLVYAMPEGVDIFNSAGKVADGVDVRGTGGFMVWWPATGGECVGGMEDIKPPPQWLLKLILESDKTVTPISSPQGGMIGSGRRNDFLSREAYRQKKLGATLEQIVTVLSALNDARCDPPLSPDEVVQIAKGKGGVAANQQSPETEPRIVLRHIADIVEDKREVEWLIDDTIEKRVIALMVGARGSLKSFVALDWLMRIAIEGNGVVALSAEGSGLGNRIEAWHKTFAPRVDLRSLHMTAMERSISLCVPDVLAELAQAIEALSRKPQILLVDTLSKYSAGLDENENSEVRDFLETLSNTLRNVYNCTILMVAHTGYAASDRIRGASSFGANTEAEYIVTRASPQDFVCKVTRERFKDSPPLEPIGYQGEVVDLGRIDKRGRPVTSLILRAGAELAVPKVRAAGSNQQTTIAALREWAIAHPGISIIPSDELGALIKRQGINRKRKPEVINWLVNAGALLPSVGGHKVIIEAIT